MGQALPNPQEDCKIEIRQVFELEDFGSSDSAERRREDGCGT